MKAVLKFLLCLSSAMFLFACQDEKADIELPALAIADVWTNMRFDTPDAVTKTITVTANGAFAATADQTWCNVKVTPGLLNNLTISLEANNAETPRTAKITLTAAGAESIEMTVRQTGTVDESLLPVGRWLFDDASNLVKADVGRDLEIVVETAKGSTGAPFSVDGPSADNKAVRIPKYTYFKAFHGIAANGGGSLVNEYTLVIDFKIPETGKWYTFFQTDLANANDGECFVRANNGFGIGVGESGYSSGPTEANVWHRLVISTALGKSYDIYLDGEKVHSTTDMSKTGVDSHYALPLEGVILFGDDDGDDGEMDIAGVSILDHVLNETKVKELGTIK
jgi:hypothetical protein